MDKIKIPLEKSHLEEHYKVKVSHKTPSKKHKTCNAEFDYCKGFYIIRSTIISFGGLFSFSRDTPPVSTQDGSTSFSRQGYYFILLASLRTKIVKGFVSFEWSTGFSRGRIPLLLLTMCFREKIRRKLILEFWYRLNRWRYGKETLEKHLKTCHWKLFAKKLNTWIQVFFEFCWACRCAYKMKKWTLSTEITHIFCPHSAFLCL